MLSYSLPSSAPTRLEVYSVSGRLVRTLVEGNVARGSWTVHWDGRDQHGHDLPSGIYFGRLEAGAEKRALKLTLLR